MLLNVHCLFCVEEVLACYTVEFRYVSSDFFLYPIQKVSERSYENFEYMLKDHVGKKSVFRVCSPPDDSLS